MTISLSRTGPASGEPNLRPNFSISGRMCRIKAIAYWRLTPSTEVRVGDPWRLVRLAKGDGPGFKLKLRTQEEVLDLQFFRVHLVPNHLHPIRQSSFRIGPFEAIPWNDPAIRLISNGTLNASLHVQYCEVGVTQSAQGLLELSQALRFTITGRAGKPIQLNWFLQAGHRIRSL